MTPVIVAVACVRPGGPVDQPKISILPREFAYFELLVVVVFVGLLVGVGVVCWLLSALLGGCWVHVGGSGGRLKGGSSQQVRFRGKGVEYDGLSCGCNRKITAR